ncbi:MAG: DUF1203 domain-containing protein [Terriglobia bacterium]
MAFDFQIVALPRENFVQLFSMSDAELAAQGARRLLVDENPGYPCRVSLMDAAIGEKVILTPFKHHDVDSPYQSAGPIFICETARTARPGVNEIPLMFHHRVLSVRAYSKNAMMIGAKVVEGRALEEAIQHFFTHRDIAYLHLHNAGAGCFNCLVQRA